MPRDILETTINTPSVARRVRRAANVRLGRRRWQTDYEHGQWWVTDLDSGAQYAAVDCQTINGIDYIDFERVSRGDE